MRLLLAGFLAFACVGCAGVVPGVRAPLERPVVSMERVGGGVVGGAVGSDSAVAALRLRARVRVANTDSVAIELQAVDWDLSLAGQPAVRGRHPLGDRVAAGADVVIAVDMCVRAAAARGLLSRWIGGDRRFALRGTIHVASARGPLGAVFDEIGTAAADPPAADTAATAATASTPLSAAADDRSCP